MIMYFNRINTFKQKHDCRIISTSDQNVITKFTFKNEKFGFEQLLASLIPYPILRFHL